MKVKYSWQDLERDCQDLAARILALRVEEGFDPSIVLGVARGGLIPAVLLARLLDLRPVASVSCAGYDGDRKAGGVTLVLPFPLTPPCEHSHVLVVDDVADTGETLALVQQELLRRHFQFRAVTLHYKPQSKVLPYLYCWKTTDWIVYPWEVE